MLSFIVTKFSILKESSATLLTNGFSAEPLQPIAHSGQQVASLPPSVLFTALMLLMITGSIFLALEMRAENRDKDRTAAFRNTLF